MDLFAAPLPDGEAKEKEANQQRPPIDIKCEGEVVSSAVLAKKTKTPEELAYYYNMCYADLPPASWPTRGEVERQWIKPAPGETNTDVWSESLPQPMRSYVCCTNGVYSVAFQTEHLDDVEEPVFTPPSKKDEEKKPVSKDEKEAAEERFYEAYALCNPAFYYKWQLCQQERNAVFRTLRFLLQYTQIKSDVRELLEESLLLTRVDPLMRQPLSALGPLISERLGKVPDAFPEGVKRNTVMKSAKRPGGEYASVSFIGPRMGQDVTPNDNNQSGTPVAAPPPPVAALRGTPTYSRLLLCKTPTPGNKKTKWQDQALRIATLHKTVPFATVNDTHLAVVYYNPEGTLEARIYNYNGHGRMLILLERVIAISLPNVDPGTPLQSVHLSTLGMLSIGLGNAAAVVDAMVDGDEPRYVYLKGKLDTPNCRRMVTSVQVVHPPAAVRPTQELHETQQQDSTQDAPQANTPADAGVVWYGSLLLGTDKGESYSIEWRSTGGVRDVDHCVAVEPILGLHYKNNRLVMHTVLALSITDMAHADTTRYLPSHRPMALDSCGSLLFVLSKYRTLDVYSFIAHQVRRSIDPPAGAPPLRAPTMHTAYKGVRAYEGHVVVLYPNGVVRRLGLPGAE